MHRHLAKRKLARLGIEGKSIRPQSRGKVGRGWRIDIDVHSRPHMPMQHHSHPTDNRPLDFPGNQHMREPAGDIKDSAFPFKHQQGLVKWYVHEVTARTHCIRAHAERHRFDVFVSMIQRSFAGTVKTAGESASSVRLRMDRGEVGPDTSTVAAWFPRFIT